MSEEESITMYSYSVWGRFGDGKTLEDWSEKDDHGFYKLYDRYNGRSRFGLISDIKMIIDDWKGTGLVEYKIYETAATYTTRLYEAGDFYER